MTGSVVQDTSPLRGDAARITELIVTDLGAPIQACPGWSLRDLVTHLGGVHRWARAAVELAGRPPATPAEIATDAPGEDDALARWFGDGAIGLANALDAHDPSDATWMPFPSIEAPVVADWIRRQTHETALHRWDAESAVARPRPIPPVLAADAIDEYFTVIVPRIVQRDGVDLPASSLHVHCTDTAGEWTVEVTNSGYAVDREHRKGDAALRGEAEWLLLRLWGRDVPDGSVDSVGDGAAIADWLAVGGS